MRNGLIEKAVEEFRNRRLAVYKTDPDQIVRDTRVAERTAKDHVGRWLFELLQNSDDAEASEVKIFIEKDTLYVADNGHGLKPKAVGAICGTDLSDKTSGTIGRKGVGFKSVYEVSQNPQILAVDGEGIEFSPEKTKAWLHENDLDDNYVPYQWIPFFISWNDNQLRGSALNSLKANGFKTVVRLTGLSAENMHKVKKLLMEWPPHALFAFRHVRKITAPNLEVVLSAYGNIWSLYDSRGQTPERWRISRLIENPPNELLETLGVDERQAISQDGVSFLIAAPLKNDCVVPTSDYLPVHVFYPTEEQSPVRLLLHAEFLVKSDRTALIPVDGNPFNAWVADRLVHHVCKFVNESYRGDSPSSHVALIAPFEERASHPVTNALWQRIAETARADLRLADVKDQQRLTVSEARLISVSVRPDLARTLLEATSLRGRLLHPAFDDDEEARKALRELGCKDIDDQDLMVAIAENGDSQAGETEWVWACWEWLAAWIAKKPYGEEHKKRSEHARSLPVLPVDGRLVKASDLAGRIVTWKPDAGMGNLPDWLPLTFVEDWFRDRMQNEAEQDSPVRKLAEELGIKEPGEDVIQRAIGRAIEQYWKDNQGDPGRFLRFILEQDWHETSKATKALQRCPVPLAQTIQGEAWMEARKAYFGREWGNDLLAEFYAGMEHVAWVACDITCNNKEKQRQVLKWLGVAGCPRIIEECQCKSVWQLPEGCDEWRKYLNTARDYAGRSVEKIASVSKLDHLTIDNRDAARGVLLIRLITKHWEAYYHNRAEVTAKGCGYRERYYRSWQVKAKWWWEICERLCVSRRYSGTKHIPLTKLWLPDKRTKRTIGNILPVVDIEAFGDDKDAVQKWLIDVVGLRRQIEQLSVDEWREILSKIIPEKAPTERLVSEDRLRDKVTGWYATCLEVMEEQENVLEKVFVSCPLLCRKGDVLSYVANEPRYLTDDNNLAEAFAEDVWLFHIPARLVNAAVMYFGVLHLSQSVQVKVTPVNPSPLSGELYERFNASLPYIWAWRSSQSKQAANKLSARLKGMQVFVVPVLKASLTLGRISHEVERRWHVDGGTIYLHKDHTNEAGFALALANALDVRSEADFYENLLRCNDDQQRKEKLLSKGIADAEIDRCLREYSGQPAEKEYNECPRQPVKAEQGGSSSQTPSGSDSPEQQPKQSPTVQPGETSGVTSLESPVSEKQPLRLKNPDTTPYSLGSPPNVSARTGGSGEGEGMEREGHSLTDAEKAVLEEAGRTLAARELESMGFSVEKMPQGNPGFDLRAKKDGDELRVEVKAHSGRATVVEITHREYKEYLRQQGYRWELWNVEHLAEDDPYQIVITRYDHIPDVALDARTYRLDLKKCKKENEDEEDSA